MFNEFYKILGIHIMLNLLNLKTLYPLHTITSTAGMIRFKTLLAM